MEGTEVRKLTQLEDRHWWYRERRHLVARAIDGLRPGTVLDVGAAGGGNTRVLQRAGWTAAALEYGAEGALVAAERGIPAVRGDATRLPFAPASLDLVVAYDVLEHIPDDATAAKQIFELLRPGGTFLVAVPCDMRLWSAHDEAVNHVRRYSREGLARVVTDAGLVVDRLWSWNVLLRPAIARYRRHSTGSDIDDPPPAPVNALLGAILVAERYLPVKSLAGVSLILRAHRPGKVAP
jgi:SAM-dependent methyltransferase